MSLSFVMSCKNAAPCFENFVTAPKSEKSQIGAVALVRRGLLAEDDVTEALLKEGTTSPDTVIDIVRALNLSGNAFLFPLGYIKGSKSMPEEILQNEVFGFDTDPKPTGEVKNLFQFKYEYFFSTQTVEWFNWLRANIEKFDVVYWTQNMVHIIEGKSVIFHNIGYQVEGDAAKTIIGGFDMKYLGDGEPVPYGPIDSSKLEGFTSLTISDPVIGPTAVFTKDTCSSDCNVYTAAAAGAVTGTADFNVTGQSSCLKWKIFLDCSSVALPANSSPVKIDENTGIVTITAMPANSSLKYRVVAISDACVIGEYCIKFVTKPA